MAVNKVEINGQTAIDLTQDTVTPETLKKGVTAHSASGEKITGTSAGSGVDVHTNTITPERYTVNLDNRTCYLNLNGLINHKFCVVKMSFRGEALDSNNIETTGDEATYQISIQYASEDEESNINDGMYCGKNYNGYSVFGGFPAIPVTGTDYTFDLSAALEETKNYGEHGMAISISEIIFSSIISWD